jgi:hypothetical protein
MVVAAGGCLRGLLYMARISSAVWQEANILGQKLNGEVRRGLIPNPIAQNPLAQSRSAMDMMRQG